MCRSQRHMSRKHARLSVSAMSIRVEHVTDDSMSETMRCFDAQAHVCRSLCLACSLGLGFLSSSIVWGLLVVLLSYQLRRIGHAALHSQWRCRALDSWKGASGLEPAGVSPQLHARVFPQRNTGDRKKNGAALADLTVERFHWGGFADVAGCLRLASCGA
jgi:hypothetical protein